MSSNRIWRSAASSALIAVLVSSCQEPTTPTPRDVGDAVGTYHATTYQARSPGQWDIDLIAAGVVWVLVINQDGSGQSAMTAVNPQTGTMPPSVVRPGLVDRTADTLRFTGFENQALLTGRTWTISGSEIFAVDQTVGGVTATIRFTRQ
jgi:hypothetical protein